MILVLSGTPSIRGSMALQRLSDTSIMWHLASTDHHQDLRVLPTSTVIVIYHLIPHQGVIYTGRKRYKYYVARPPHVSYLDMNSSYQYMTSLVHIQA